MTNPGTDNLVVVVEPQGDAVVMMVSGEIDIVTAAQFEAALEAALLDRPATLVVDLTEITFLASAGLGVLAAVVRRAEDGTKIKVVADGPVTARPLQLTGLDEVIAVFATRSEALIDA